MNRLTKDLHNQYNDYWYREDLDQVFDKEQIILTKLGQYEDLEEELGIDLITLFKAQTQGFYIINVFNEIEKVRLSEWRFNLAKKEIQRVKSSKHLSFTNYGKTWSLTKEELENDSSI